MTGKNGHHQPAFGLSADAGVTRDARGFVIGAIGPSVETSWSIQPFASAPRLTTQWAVRRTSRTVAKTIHQTNRALFLLRKAVRRDSGRSDMGQSLSAIQRN